MIGNERTTPDEYSNMKAGPIYRGRLPAGGGFSRRSMVSLSEREHGYANAFLVEGLLALGASMGIGLLAVLVEAGW